MLHLWNGILLGLGLSLLVGPILIALVQTGIEQGVRAGLAVGSGIWMSDILFITATYLGLTYVEALIRWPGFEQTLGIVGGIILILFGLGTLLSKPTTLDWKITGGRRQQSYARLWLKGFLINTLNPFTVFVWTGVAGGLLAEASEQESTYLFYWGVMGTIVFFDSMKVVLAKMVRRWLKPKAVWWVRRLSGFALLVFGVLLMVRVLV